MYAIKLGITRSLSSLRGDIRCSAVILNDCPALFGHYLFLRSNLLLCRREARVNGPRPLHQAAALPGHRHHLRHAGRLPARRALATRRAAPRLLPAQDDGPSSPLRRLLRGGAAAAASAGLPRLLGHPGLEPAAAAAAQAEAAEEEGVHHHQGERHTRYWESTILGLLPRVAVVLDSFFFFSPPPATENTLRVGLEWPPHASQNLQLIKVQLILQLFSELCMTNLDLGRWRCTNHAVAFPPVDFRPKCT